MTEPAGTTIEPQAAARPLPFRFYTSLILQEATGLRAATLPTLVKLLELVPESCIYHHTHHFLLQHHYLTPEPTNDFAYWVTEVLGEAPLGERLASLDVMAHTSLDGLRKTLIEIIRGYLHQSPWAKLRFVREGQEFFFIKTLHVIMPTPYQASTLDEFAQALRQVSVPSLYYHMFASRLRLGRPSNDFAVWIEQQLGLPGLAQDIAQLDPYAHTLESLRSLLLSLIHQELGRSHA